MGEDYENSLERQILDRLTRIETKVDGYDKIKETVYQNQRDITNLDSKADLQNKLNQTQIEQMETKIATMQDSNRWLVRTVGGVVITAVIGVIIASIRLGVGG